MDALIHEKKINEIQIQLFMYLSLATSASLPRQKRAAPSGGMPRHFGTCILARAPRPLSRPRKTWFCLVMLSAVPFSFFIHFLKSISELDVHNCKSRLPNQHNSSPVSFFNWVVRAGLYGRCQPHDFSWNGAGKLDGRPLRLDWDGPWHEVLHMWHAHAQQHPEDNTFTLRRINNRSQVCGYVAGTAVGEISGVSLAPQRGIKLHVVM